MVITVRPIRLHTTITFLLLHLSLSWFVSLSLFPSAFIEWSNIGINHLHRLPPIMMMNDNLRRLWAMIIIFIYHLRMNGVPRRLLCCRSAYGFRWKRIDWANIHRFEWFESFKYRRHTRTTAHTHDNEQAKIEHTLDMRMSRFARSERNCNKVEFN